MTAGKFELNLAIASFGCEYATFFLIKRLKNPSVQPNAFISIGAMLRFAISIDTIGVPLSFVVSLALW